MVTALKRTRFAITPPGSYSFRPELLDRINLARRMGRAKRNPSLIVPQNAMGFARAQHILRAEGLA